ncbi:MAG TPA: hemerythrin domain-containing protein [Acidimicrobiales bacterium]|jgi:uncharacterized protein (TIGR02246 family)|nr:hemerythrin domain-containing protein [Acidimicrobiales bacterium]
MTLPSVLAPLNDDRRRLDAVLELLEETSEPEARADLADEAVRLCARYEDVMERVLYPLLRRDSRLQVDRAEREQRQVRAALRDMRARTRHVHPIDAHASDPEGFEQSLGELIDLIRSHLSQEDQDLLPMANRLGADAQAELHNRIERAVVHASSHPSPPHNRIGHALVNLMDKVDRTIRDSSTTWHPGLDLLSDHNAARPSLDVGGTVTREAAEAVTALVAELQAGFDEHDADISNRHFASDVLWGSPFGATVDNFEELHAIHARLKQQGTGGPSSRFEIVKVLSPVPGVAVAQVRRVALDPDGRPVEPTDDTATSFSEMALYVLVRRNRTWWLVAGQNTPVRPAPWT